MCSFYYTEGICRPGSVVCLVTTYRT